MNDFNSAAGSRLHKATCCARPLQVPRRRPEKWQVGDIGIDYITARQDHDPRPPCQLVMVVASDDEKFELSCLDGHYPLYEDPEILMGVEEAIAEFERTSDDLTVKSARIGLTKIMSLAEPFAPWPSWIEAVDWWEAHPEDRPDGYDVIRTMIRHNSEQEGGQVRGFSDCPECGEGRWYEVDRDEVCGGCVARMMAAEGFDVEGGAR